MKPSLQPSIKLDSFQVENIEFTIGTILDKTITKDVEFSLNYNVLPSKDENRFGIRFNISITNDDKGLSLLVTAIGHFSMSGVDDTETFLKSDFVIKSAPAIAFPYLRSFISTLLINSGLNSVILPALNFSLISEDKEEQKSIT